MRVFIYILICRWVWDHRHKTVSVVVEILLQVKEKTLRQDKGSESNVCIRVGPDGAVSHDRFRNSPTGPLITFRDGPRGLGEVGGRPSSVAIL